MDPDTKRYYINLAILAASLIVCILFMAWEVFEVFVIKKDTSSSFIIHRSSYFIEILGMIIILLLLASVEYVKREVSLSLPPESRSDASIMTIAKTRFDTRMSRLFPEKVVNSGIALVFTFILIGFTYFTFHSFPLMLIILGIVLVCYGIVRQMIPGAAWGIAFAIIIICVGFPIVLFGNVLFIPDLMPVEPIPRLVFQSAPFVYAILLLVLLLYFWVSDNGIPFLRPLTDEDLQEPCEEELILSLPFDRVFERCREAVLLLPNYRIDDDEPSYGSLGVTVNPGRGRASTIQFTVETIHDRQTRVKISIKSPRPSFGNEPRTRTYVNEKYLQIVGGYLRTVT